MKEFSEFIFYFSFLLIFIYFLLLLLAPLLIQSDNRFLLGVGAVSYIFNILMCHQLPQRSFFLFGEQMPICSRDASLFFGVLAAYILSALKLPSVLKKPHLAFLGVILLGVDGVLQFLGVWESTNFSRAFTGFFAGFAITSYVIEVFIGRWSFKRKVAWRAFLSILPLLIIFISASFYVGERYLTKSEVLSKAKAINNSSFIRVFYMAPRAFSSSISSDVYIKDYNDTVLRDVAKIGNGKHPYGVWVAVLSNESHGRYVFASEGVNYFYDAMSGEFIGKFEH